MNRYPSRQPRRSITLDDIRRLANERDQLAHAVRELQDRQSSVAAKLAETTAALGDERARNDELKARRDELEEQVDAQAETIADLERAVSAAEEVQPLEGDDRLERLERRVAELTDDLARAQRREREARDSAGRDERRRLLAGLGDVLDSVDRALDAAGDDDPWQQGLQAIRAQLLHFFTSEGAVLTGEVGEPMDPRVHEALGVVEADDFARGEIVRVHRPGIELDDGSLVRTAQVLVAR